VRQFEADLRQDSGFRGGIRGGVYGFCRHERDSVLLYLHQARHARGKKEPMKCKKTALPKPGLRRYPIRPTCSIYSMTQPRLTLGGFRLGKGKATDLTAEVPHSH
jgi:hypothetical protein